MDVRKVKSFLKSEFARVGLVGVAGAAAILTVGFGGVQEPFSALFTLLAGGSLLTTAGVRAGNALINRWLNRPAPNTIVLR